MRTLAALLLALAATLTTVTGAAADHHNMKVNELSLSSGGDPSAQFVELQDPIDEPFPPTFYDPYGLAVYDASGMPAGSQSFGNPFAMRDNTQPWLIASASSGLSGDATLTVALPQGSGQVCFTASGGAERVHCLAYGCPAAPLGSTGGTEQGLAPPDGQSLQRVNGSLALGAPTPKAANTASGSATCAGGTVGGPQGGGGGVAGGDGVAPRLALSARRRQRLAKLSLRVRSNEAAKLTVTGTVAVPGSARTLRFKTLRRQLKAGVRATLKPKLSRAGVAAAMRALRRGRKLTAKFRLSAVDAAHNKRAPKRESIRLAL